MAFIDSAEDCASAPLECVIAAGGGDLVDGRLAVAELGYGASNAVHPGEQFVAAVYDGSVVAAWARRPSGRGPSESRSGPPAHRSLHTLDLGPTTEQTPIHALTPAAPPATTSRGIGLVVAGQPIHADALDYNHDGWQALVVVAEGADTVDFYLNYHGDGFNRFPVDVGGRPQAPEVGDYDGDLLADVAITVADAINPQGLDRLMIMYSDPDARPSEAQLLGQFVSPARPSRFAGGLSAGGASLLVTSNAMPEPDSGGACDRRLAVLIGDTSRQLVSPFILLYDDGQGGQEPIYPLGLIDVTTGGIPQVFAFGAVFPSSGAPASATVISLLGFDGTASDRRAVRHPG